MTKECPMTNDQAALTTARAAVLVELWALGLGHSLVIGHWSLVIGSKGPSFVLNSTAVVRGPHHSMTAAAQVRPAPKTTIKTRSPRWMRPWLTASSSAMATEAAEVFP